MKTMAEYTYKDIIIDPDSEEAKNAIGKEVYFADTPASCLNAAKNNNKAYLGYLKKLDLGDEEQPFYVNEFVVSAPSSWTCIIVKKEEPKPKYVPFDTIEEFVKASFEHNKNHYLAGTGIWIKEKSNDHPDEQYIFIVDCFSMHNNIIHSGDSCWNLKEILKIFTFLDDTPCGKEVKDE